MTPRLKRYCLSYSVRQLKVKKEQWFQRWVEKRVQEVSHIIRMATKHFVYRRCYREMVDLSFVHARLSRESANVNCRDVRAGDVKSHLFTNWPITYYRFPSLWQVSLILCVSVCERERERKWRKKKRGEILEREKAEDIEIERDREGVERE